MDYAIQMTFLRKARDICKILNSMTSFYITALYNCNAFLMCIKGRMRLTLY